MRKSKGMRRMAKGGMKMMRASKGGTKMMKARVGQMADRPMNTGNMGRGSRARPMGAMKGKMASKGYAKGGVKKMNVGGMSISKLRTEAKKNGMKLVKI